VAKKGVDMKKRATWKVGMIFGVLICLLSAANAATSGTLTVNKAYPNLASGVLSYAGLEDLKGDLLLKCGSYEINKAEMEIELKNTPENMQEEMKANLFFLLEQKATEAILLQTAKEEAGSAAIKPEGEKADQEKALIKSHLEKMVEKTSVEDAEIVAFFEANKEMLSGSTLEQVKEQLRAYLLQQKRQEATGEYIRTIGQKRAIAVSSSWTKAQAELAMKNPVDAARKSGKPSFVNFGAGGCGPCDMMEPVREEIKVDYEGIMNVEFIDVRENKILASRYAIQSIPVLVLFDKDGKEVWRGSGFIPREQIEAQFGKAGVKVR
jgi:thioredoxin 1